MESNFVLILSYATIVLAAAGCITTIAVSSNQAMARQPEVQARVATTFILGAAFCEMLGLLGFVLALLKG